MARRRPVTSATLPNFARSTGIRGSQRVWRLAGSLEAQSQHSSMRTAASLALGCRSGRGRVSYARRCPPDVCSPCSPCCSSWESACSGDEVQLPEAPRTSARRPPALGQHRARARRPDPGLGREPRVDRVLAPARVAAADLAREQRGPERRDPDPADRAELRGVGAPARRSLALRAGHPDVLVRARATSLPRASSTGRSRSPGSRRRRRSCSGSRSARSTARR